MATLSLRSLKIIITSRNRVSTPGDFPRRIVPIDDRHGVISGTWLHSADVATTSHFLRGEEKEELQCGPHVTVVQGKYSPKFSYNIRLFTIYVVVVDTESRSDYAGGLIRLLVYNSLVNVRREEVVA